MRSLTRLLWRTTRGLWATLRLLARDGPIVARDALAAFQLMTGPHAGGLHASDAVKLVQTARRFGLDAHDLWMVWANYANQDIHDAVTKALEIQSLYRRKPGPATLN